MHEPYPLFACLRVQPVLIHTPAASGYTLRCCRDDHAEGNAEEHADGYAAEPDPVFLGRDGAVFAFRSTGTLVEFLGSGEAHDLAGLPNWDPPDWNEVALVADIALTYVAHEQYPVCRLDADAIAGVFRREPSFDTVQEALETFGVARELAVCADLGPVREALAPGSVLRRFEDDLRWAYFTKAGLQNRPRPADHDHDALAATWAEVAARVVPVVRFRD
ncbi:hypothetical protein [Streptomyces odontomachi]|uniref:hypothetical protein n=1 Tax=Streptomyces odontomachi TaxID=2944940 RepID=UPI00210B06B7|nr:hypothetical protein [Streptomyces sp. ODS25]